MKTKTKVKSVQSNGTWTSKEGKLYYKHEYLFEDNNVMSALHETQQPFKEGDEVEYEVKKENQYGKSGNVSKVNDFQQGFKKSNKGGNGSFALSYAKDLVIAGKVELKDILHTADKFKDWLDGSN